MSAIDNVKAHYSSRGQRELEVPEWGITIHAKPMTVGETARNWRRADGETEAYWAHSIISHAMDEEGNPHFAIGNMDDLLWSADGDVVARVGTWITQSQTSGDHSKNSETTKED